MSREALLTPCPKCGAETITTDWDPIEHMPTPRTWRADPAPLTPELEAVCIIVDRPTFGHYTRGNTHELALREPHWHRYHHRGHPTHVLPAHQCGHSLPIPATSLAPTATETDTNTPCPY